MEEDVEGVIETAARGCSQPTNVPGYSNNEGLEETPFLGGTHLRVTMWLGGANGGSMLASIFRNGGSSSQHCLRAASCLTRHSWISASLFCWRGSYMWMRIWLKMTESRHICTKQDVECAAMGGYFTPSGYVSPKGVHISFSLESSTAMTRQHSDMVWKRRREGDCSRRGPQHTDHLGRRDIRVLEAWRPAKVQADDLVPEVTAPKQSAADLDIFVTEWDVARIPLAVDTYAEMINHPEGHAAVHPCLRSVARAALLSTQQQQRLHGRDGRYALRYLVEDHGPGMSAEDGAAVVVILQTFTSGLVPAAPADGMG